MRIYFKIFILYFFSSVVIAQTSRGGLGEVASHLMDPVNFFSGFIQTGCLLIGGLFLFASIVKYFEHRRSPLMVPISTVIFLIVAGIILILLPFLAYFTDNGTPYSILRAG